jgi:hypothetical protein
MRSSRWPRLSARAMLVLLLVFAAVACSGGGQPAVDVPAGTHSVPLQIVEGPGGSTLALVPIYIEDQGPLLFALDTGASKSVVDRNVVQQLNIPIIGDAGPTTGAGGMVLAKQIRVEQWRVGDVDLPPSVIVTIDLPEPGAGIGLRGLLGSDILSNFDVITIDYVRGVLILGSQRPSPSPAPATRSGLSQIAFSR